MMDIRKPLLWGAFVLTVGGFTICTETYGSGVEIVIRRIYLAVKIRNTFRQIPKKFIAEGRGEVLLIDAVLQCGFWRIEALSTNFSVSAWRSWRSDPREGVLGAKAFLPSFPQRAIFCGNPRDLREIFRVFAFPRRARPCAQRRCAMKRSPATRSGRAMPRET